MVMKRGRKLDARWIDLNPKLFVGLSVLFAQVMIKLVDSLSEFLDSNRRFVTSVTRVQGRRMNRVPRFFPTNPELHALGFRWRL